MVEASNDVPEGEEIVGEETQGIPSAPTEEPLSAGGAAGPKKK